MAIEAASLLVKVGADTYQAELNLKKFGNQLERTAQSSARATKATGQMGAGLKDVNRWAGVAAGGLAGLAEAAGVGALVGFAGNIAAGAVELAKLGEQTMALERSFEGLAAQAGASGRSLVRSLREASGGAISDANLMLAANKSMLLGVADTAEEMGALMEVARTRGQAMGLTVTQAFDNLVTGLGRGSALILDNLGITFDAEQVYADYAASIDKTAGELSELEKKQALVNLIMQEAEGATLAAANNWERLAAAMANFRAELGKETAGLLGPLAGVAATGVQGVADLMGANDAISRPSLAEEEARLRLEGLTMSIAAYERALRGGTPATAEFVAQLAEWRVQVAELTGEMARLEEERLAGTGAGAAAAQVEAVTAALTAAREARQAAMQEQAADFAEIEQMAGKLADSLLETLGPGVWQEVAGWADRWQEQFIVLTEHGYTADQALKIIALDAQRMGDALLDAAGNGALEELSRDAVLAQGGLAGAALAAADLAAAVRAVKGVYAGGPLSLGGFDPFGGSIGGGAKKGGIPGNLGPRMADPFEKLVRRTSDFGQALDDATGAAKGLESALGGIPGLFGASKVTQDQLDMAELGVPQNFADDYLRQLTDEVLNGVDWAGVDIQDAARRAGIDPTLPAEAILKMFTQAWEDSSLFANPENLDLLNADAIQAALDKAQASAEGEANLRALFGLGEDETVAAVAALGLDVQTSLAGWLKENGLADAGTATAEALGVGVKDNGDALGGGVTLGLFNWASSKEGDTALRQVGEELAKRVSNAMKVTPSLELPGTGAADPRAGLAGRGLPGFASGTDWFGGGLAWVGESGPELVRLPRGSAVYDAQRSAGIAAGAVVINYSGPATAHELSLLARRVARELQARGA